MARSFTTLPARDKLTVLILWVGLIGVDLRLRLLPYRWNRTYLAEGGGCRTRSVQTHDSAWAWELADLVRIAASHPGCFTMSCLRRALVIRSRLNKAGIAAELAYGVRKQEPGAGSPYATHAWVETEFGRIDPANKDAEYSRFS